MKLTRNEQAIFDLLSKRSPEVVSREDIVAVCRSSRANASQFGFSNIADVHIKNLRRKIDREITSVRGVGYRLE
ncbi:protein of unknown function; putative Two component transcriptional regulator, winged helix family [Bradyrhizobium sp. ORS 285]|uniref:winged helix-turn-helix domain-containing protein n=1 Tax=Bradyrhizobium sp. ORS 285 TaxID=115808 RepID=UPI00024095B5|nr:winged helix-turn-helix domain-containing protein [Bradyrhizobium sp. ORS 285]CCD89881.1 hypothetical protein; putative Two component transcriptional regulator, winged helix family [Bradyrhizobium sp. ORS 285]SMX61494.1 protein of unknown function; putative Two component transcriptional regulator, winged helix family [Bradyrhizobium sp. ORS 285]